MGKISRSTPSSPVTSVLPAWLPAARSGRRSAFGSRSTRHVNGVAKAPEVPRRWRNDRANRGDGHQCCSSQRKRLRAKARPRQGHIHGRTKTEGLGTNQAGEPADSSFILHPSSFREGTSRPEPVVSASEDRSTNAGSIPGCHPGAPLSPVGSSTGSPALAAQAVREGLGRHAGLLFRALSFAPPLPGKRPGTVERTVPATEGAREDSQAGGLALIHLRARDLADYWHAAFHRRTTELLPIRESGHPWARS